MFGVWFFVLHPPLRPGFLCAVSRLHPFVKYWLPIVLWLALIFAASGDGQSAQRSSRIIGPLVHWLFPDLPETTVGNIVFIVRKCAHLTEYAVLAWLFWRALRKPVRNDPRPWNWREAWFALGGVLLYAISDEVHQSFIPSRQGSVWDVLLDTLGAAAGLLVLWVSHRRRNLKKVERR